MADKKTKAAAKPGGKKLIVILVGVVAVLGISAGWYLKRPKSAQPAAAEPAAHETVPEPPKEKPKPVVQSEGRQLLPGEIRNGIIVPLTRENVIYVEHKIRGSTETCCMMIAELDRMEIPQKLTQFAEPDRIVVSLANSYGKGIVVMEIGMRVRHLDVIRQINERQHLIFDRIATVVSKKTQAESNRSDFKTKVQKELLAEINLILGGRAVSELVFYRFRLS